MPIAQQLGVPLTLITSNGAITKSMGGELFYRDLLPLTTAQRLCAHMAEFRGCMVITFDRDDKGTLVLERSAAFTGSILGWMQKNAAFISEIEPIEQCLTCDPVQAMFCGGIEAMRRVHARLAELNGEVTVLRTEYPKRDLSIIDVLHAKCSKGVAVERWARHMGIARDQVTAIGDNYNDIEMLESAGEAFVVANAADELKDRWPVVPSNDDCGVAAAVDQLLRTAKLG